LTVDDDDDISQVTR